MIQHKRCNSSTWGRHVHRAFASSFRQVIPNDILWSIIDTMYAKKRRMNASEKWFLAHHYTISGCCFCDLPATNSDNRYRNGKLRCSIHFRFVSKRFELRFVRWMIWLGPLGLVLAMVSRASVWACSRLFRVCSIYLCIASCVWYSSNRKRVEYCT